MNKTDNPGKTAIHWWLNRHFGKPKKCEVCGTENQHIVYEWANIKNHNYKRSRDNFKRMCRSCHRKHDLTPKKEEKAIENLWWKKGINNPSTDVKLSPEKVKKIRKKIADGENKKVIARNFGAHVTTIERVIRKETWSHV